LHLTGKFSLEFDFRSSSLS